MWYMLYYSGCTHSVNNYFKIYTEYKPQGKEYDTEVNFIGGVIKPNGVGTVVLDLEDEKGQIHNLNFKQVYYLPGAPNFLIIPHK